MPHRVRRQMRALPRWEVEIWGPGNKQRAEEAQRRKKSIVTVPLPLRIYLFHPANSTGCPIFCYLTFTNFSKAWSRFVVSIASPLTSSLPSCDTAPSFSTAWYLITATPWQECLSTGAGAGVYLNRLQGFVISDRFSNTVPGNHVKSFKRHQCPGPHLQWL